ncbi:NUDIX domain-containing protein [Anaerocolumna jejuensis DSM 15929]|uniref:NUDIX domain-containing protein n=1 Tax=Anaerocolumna jejuensis DSM 15929 TaxID=1121322 RepID=A0A1M6PNZ6_9FIRM|nr:NUDIX domain-containing protein [Anaerocolumna jejuensis]SHK09672.1 NUDIX domain-containing protein [Anaerocolumna jejuensis DSM 15929]
MYFKHQLGLQDIAGRKINTREAVRAVILLENKLLLVKTVRGDYKFPGGGRKAEEDDREALVREVKEETGFRVTEVREPVGEIIENYKDACEPESVFRMTSAYYLCEIFREGEKQQLDDYEAELGFQPVFIGAREALKLNEEIFAREMEHSNIFLSREICALKEIIKFI